MNQFTNKPNYLVDNAYLFCGAATNTAMIVRDVLSPHGRSPPYTAKTGDKRQEDQAGETGPGNESNVYPCLSAAWLIPPYYLRRRNERMPGIPARMQVREYLFTFPISRSPHYVELLRTEIWTENSLPRSVDST